ncbi:hypothetical protein GQ44DRAFT_702089, partial [Phaeosphaeriaceae sp. PMI808]
MMVSTHYTSRWTQQRGTRPVRIANCSGYKADPGYHMRYHVELGDVDLITSDYIAENAQSHTAGTNCLGWYRAGYHSV